jgi:exodeoxyribonuclease X
MAHKWSTAPLSNVALIDLETTGDDPLSDVPIEVAIIRVSSVGKVESTFSTLIHPGDRPISPIASACHHITLETFHTKSLNYMSQLSLESWAILLEDVDYLVAHNAAFDRAFVPIKTIPWICTYRVAKHTMPDAPKFGLQVLRYWLDLPVKAPTKLHPHRALYDTYSLLPLYRFLRQSFTDAELAYMSSQPVLLTTAAFGKHKGTPWQEIPKDYLQWIIKNEFDEDTDYTARYYLAA